MYCPKNLLTAQKAIGNKINDPYIKQTADPILSKLYLSCSYNFSGLLKFYKSSCKVPPSVPATLLTKTNRAHIQNGP